jgi:hypothetical protein
VASVGTDSDGIKKVFLFTIKEGNLKRTDWDNTSPQAVRPSLEEILDVYIPTHLPKQYNNMTKKIVVATGGDLEQTVHQNWSGYTKRNSQKDEIEFDFWGGDKLSILIDEHIFNEHIIPQNLRSKFRRTLALIGDTDYNLIDYFEFLDEILLKNKLETKNDKDILKNLRLIFLSLNVVTYWSKSEENLKHSLLASERTLLNLYNFMASNNLMKKRNLKELLYKVYQIYFNNIKEYANKIYPSIEIENGLSFRGYDFLQESLILFEQLGIVALYGNLYYSSVYINQNEDEFDYSEYEDIKEHLKMMIINHKGLYNPVYDEHIIDISLALNLFELWNEIKFIDDWIYNLISHIQFAYYQDNYFPIDSNDFEDLVDCNLGDGQEKKKYMQTSTLIPTLAFWCIKLGLIENYRFLYTIVNEIYKDTTLQIWFPDKDLEKYVYVKKASIDCGYVFAPLSIKKNISDMAKMIEKLRDSEHIMNLENNEMPILYFASSRHFRMPILPNVLMSDMDIIINDF